jgi:hypothetical protein
MIPNIFSPEFLGMLSHFRTGQSFTYICPPVGEQQHWGRDFQRESNEERRRTKTLARHACGS